MLFSIRSSSKIARAFLLLALVTLLASCAIFQSGAPVSSIKVTAASGQQVEAAAIDAFTLRGFRVVGNDGRQITFERDASKWDRALYGNWNEDTLAERVVVRIERDDANFYHLACIPYAVRGVGTGMEDQTRRTTVYSREYSSALRDVRSKLASPRANENYLPRERTAAPSATASGG